MGRWVEERHKVRVTSEDGETTLGEVSAIIARPEPFSIAAVIAHGAGGDMNSRLTSALQERLAADGIAAARFNFLYTEKRRRAPDRRPHLEACWRAVADWTRERLAPKKLFLGGKSMGGRMISYLAADGYPADGLFFLGYPLHPPGRTSQLRKDHLPAIRIPLLFIQGSRDSLCDLDLLRPVVEEMETRATLHVIEEGDHSFRLPKRLGRTEAEVTDEIYRVLFEWMRSVSGGSR